MSPGGSKSLSDKLGTCRGSGRSLESIFGRFWREGDRDYWMHFPERLRFHALLSTASAVIRLVYVSVIVEQRACYCHKHRILHYVDTADFGVNLVKQIEDHPIAHSLHLSGYLCGIFT